MTLYRKIIILLFVLANLILYLIFLENMSQRKQFESFAGWVTTNFYPPIYENDNQK